MEKLAIVIPARMHSVRFPGKALHPILEKPLVVWAAEGASQSKYADRVIVATDDERIASVVRDAGFEAVMTREDHPSGTDRVWEVAEGLEAAWILNLQGDEPLITGEILDSLAEVAIGGNGDEHEIVTLIRRLEPEEVIDPNRVKVVIDQRGDALYFSRSPIPYIRERLMEEKDRYPSPKFHLHIGLYLYRRDILEKFIGLKQTPLEMAEGLEQLRALENGIRIHCVETGHEFLGVDSKTDVPKVEAALRARGKAK